jgi:predicted nucleotidyltransferase
VDRGDDTAAGFFGRFGDRLELRSYDELRDRLAQVERPVPRRTEGRTADDRDRYCIVRYLEYLAEATLLELPVVVERGQAPDFVLRFDGRSRGVEVTEGTTAALQEAATRLERAPPGTLLEGTELREPGEPLRGDPYGGDQPEREWTAQMLDAVERKSRGFDYGTHDELELLIYDHSEVGALVRLEDGAPFLREAVRAWRREAGVDPPFSRYSVLKDSGLLFDVTGRWQVLRRRFRDDREAPAERRPRPEPWPAQEEIAALCRRHRIRRLALFGSVLHGDHARDSDIDLLVEFEPGVRMGLIRLAGVERELSRLFRRSVDLRTPGELAPEIRERVLREAETQYAAP